MTGIVFEIKEFAVFYGPGIQTTVFSRVAVFAAVVCLFAPRD